MLANGSVPMLATAASGDARLTAGGDMLDRRNLAASPPPGASNATDEPDSLAGLRIAEVQQGQRRAQPPLPPGLSSAVMMGHPRPTAKRYTVVEHGAHDAPHRGLPSNGSVPFPNANTSSWSDPSNDALTVPRLQQHRRPRPTSSAPISSTTDPSVAAPFMARGMRPSPPPEAESDQPAALGTKKPTSLNRASRSPPRARATTPTRLQRGGSPPPFRNGTGSVASAVDFDSESDPRVYAEVEPQSVVAGGGMRDAPYAAPVVDHDGRYKSAMEAYRRRHPHHQPPSMASMVHTSRPSTSSVPPVSGVHRGVEQPGFAGASTLRTAEMGYEDAVPRRGGRCNNHGYGFNDPMNGGGSADHTETLFRKAERMNHGLDKRAPLHDLEYRWDAGEETQRDEHSRNCDPVSEARACVYVGRAAAVTLSSTAARNRSLRTSREFYLPLMDIFLHDQERWIPRA